MTKNAEQALETLVDSLEKRCFEQDEEIIDLQKKLAQINYDIFELKQKLAMMTVTFK